MPFAAIDLGRRRIGVAVTDAASVAAHPLGVVERRGGRRDLDAIAAMLAGRDIETIVVGLPLNMDGSEGTASRAARAFAARLAAALAIRVELFDERLSSAEADARIAGVVSARKARRNLADAVAAAVILEGWLAARDRER